MEYTRGSEWRRWDIHIHTPETKMNDNFEGQSPIEKWDKFYSDILTYIGDGKDPQKAIAGLGITDYFSIDNYNKVIRDARLNDKIPFIFPNIELRMFPTGKEPINIHCLFNPAFANKIENKFFAKLIWTRTNGKGNLSCSKADLISLGKESDKSLTDNQAYVKGIENFIITPEALIELFKDKELRENTLIAIDNGTNAGISTIGNGSKQNSASRLITLSVELKKFADIILASDDGSIKYYLGEKEKVSKETVLTECGSLKPCLHGCDAHSNNAIFEPLDSTGNHTKRYCWIKADPTFNGLKQVMYEPKDRVRICENRPEQKNDYQLIDKVIINNPDFQQEEIVFNQNLTCIIGGRASGKSILLRAIARNIDAKQIDEKNETISKAKPYIIQGLSVYWKDDNIPNKQRKITYIPQTYLNRLTDDQENKTEIDDLIENIILRDENIKRLSDNLKEKLREIKNNLNRYIADLISKEETVTDLQQQIEELGNEDAITKQIKKLTTQRDEIAQKNNCSVDDIKNFAENKSKLLTLENELNELNNNKTAIESIKSLLQKGYLPSNLLTKYKTSMDDEANAEIKEVDKKWEIKKQEILSEINTNIQTKLSEKTKLSTSVTELAPKIEITETIKKLTEQIDTETKKLNKVKELLKQQKTVNDEKNMLIDKLISSSGAYKIENETYASKLGKIFTDTNKSFYANVFYKTEQFCIKFGEIFIKAFLKQQNIDEEIIRNDSLNPNFDFDDGNKKEFIIALLKSNKALKSGHTVEDGLKVVLDDYFNISYGATLGDTDLINQMSPGKKALLLLKLLIELDDSTNPILIDQPEDDLDNKSIFNDLVQFIKDKKKQRQIILITHNANISIGCDAEEIIIANHQGVDAPNNLKTFEYRSGAIENNEPRYDDKRTTIKGTLNQTGIQQQACGILEGGKEAFDIRNNKYVKNQ
ncbi:MAG: hypothetical protein LBN07_03760 [Christensenellaceae bacterium]|jgi:ABC-type cobalamin/Fe3+-siderophores transport system ATPase subunit|nr:hypothetical protein [Christensenellaceae bacterium]